jgi:hypothetical protein
VTRSHRPSLSGLAFALLLTLGLALASCSGGGSAPFAKKDGSPDGKPVPPITLGAIAGIPPDQLQPLKDALAISGGKRDIGIVEGQLDGAALGMTGKFEIIPDASTIRIGYAWAITDPTGRVLHTISAEETLNETPGPNPWAQVTPAALQRIAAYTTENLSSWLSQMGYATQTGGLPPPLGYLAEAGPGAENDVDYETFYGPGKVPPDKMVAAYAETAPVESVTARNLLDPQAPEIVADGKGDVPIAESLDAVAEAAESDPIEEGSLEPAANGKHQIKAVAVLAVKGAPGEGNAELTNAMRETLKEAGWPVLSKPRPDALTISGKVKVDPAKGETQKVALAWTVSSPDGRKLGTISQANDIPVGSLDDGWGDDAFYVAQAAAGGIYDLVKRYQ